MSYTSGLPDRITILQKNDQQTAKLRRLLTAFYNRKIKNKEIANLRNRTEPELRSIIHSFMVESYQRAASDLNDKFQALPFYDLNASDLNEIENMQNTILDKFYYQIDRIERRNQGIALAERKDNEPDLSFVSDISLSISGNVIDKQELNVLAYLKAVSESVVFGGFGLGMTFGKNKILSSMEIDQADFILNNFAYKFLTKMDDLVCEEFCRPLENKIYQLDDPNIPSPVKQHYHCRCILVLVKRKTPILGIGKVFGIGRAASLGLNIFPLIGKKEEEKR